LEEEEEVIVEAISNFRGWILEFFLLETAAFGKPTADRIWEDSGEDLIQLQVTTSTLEEEEVLVTRTRSTAGMEVEAVESCS